MAVSNSYSERLGGMNDGLLCGACTVGRPIITDEGFYICLYCGNIGHRDKSAPDIPYSLTHYIKNHWLLVFNDKDSIRAMKRNRFRSGVVRNPSQMESFGKHLNKLKAEMKVLEMVREWENDKTRRTENSGSSTRIHAS